MSRIIIITPPPPPPSSGLAAVVEYSRNADAVSVVEGETAKRLIEQAMSDGSRIRIVDTEY